jgi:hypothetical protein
LKTLGRRSSGLVPSRRGRLPIGRRFDHGRSRMDYLIQDKAALPVCAPGQTCPTRRESIPRGTLQNRPMRDTSKPANETESGQALLYLAGGPSGN